MSRRANLTNDKAVKALKWVEGDPIQFAVKDKSHKGFYIRVSSGGTKRWYFQYKMNGRLRRLWFDRYPKVSCAEAFGKYENARKEVEQGIDVVAEKQSAAEKEQKRIEKKAFTLSFLFHEHYLPRYAKEKKRTWRNDEVYFTTKIEPSLGSKSAEEVTPEDVERLIRPMELVGYNTARLTLAVLRKLYNWAASPSAAETPGDGPLLSVANPCRLYKLDSSNAPDAVVRVLAEAEVRDLWNHMGDSQPERIIRLQLLTGCRVSEVAGMRESEIDRNAREWNLPASRSKTKRPLTVPLTVRMAKLIGPASGDFVFPAKSKKGHTTTSGVYQALKRHCKALDIQGIATHTMRRTFTTNMARLGVPLEIRNRLTNHKDPSIDAIYNQHDYFSERLAALEKWDSRLDSILNRVKD